MALHPRPITLVEGFSPDGKDWKVRIHYADGEVEIWNEEEAQDLGDYYQELGDLLEYEAYDHRPRLGPPIPYEMMSPFDKMMHDYGKGIAAQIARDSATIKLLN